jgi:hypothetical protein
LLSLILVDLENKQRSVYGSYMDAALNAVAACETSRMAKDATRSCRLATCRNCGRSDT